MANRFLNNIRINDAYTFPASDGNDGQVITTDGAGNLAFENVSPDAASVIYRDNFTGDGNTASFDLQNPITDEDQTQIYIDGVYQEKDTYSVSGSTITFTTAPLNGHSVEVISISSINTGPTVLYQDNFTGNGNDTAFTLGQIIDNEIKTFIFLNGVYQFKNTYTLDGTTLTFDTAPANGVSIEVISIASATQSDSLEAGAVIIPVKNTHTASISKGTPVYITGNVGASERLQIAPADASDSTKMPAAGLLLTTLAVNAEGYVITGGYLRNITTDTIDSTSTSPNDTVYVKAGGGLTMTKPTGSNLIQNIAKVARSASGSSGSLIVSSILRTNDIPNLTTGKIWVGDSNTVESTVIHLDESNNRLGINNNSPSYSLDVTGDANISSNLIVGGNLTVQGTETILNTQTVEVEDNILQLNTTQGSPDTATATTSGISVYRGNGVTQASFIFDDADDTWDLTNNLVVAGTLDLGRTIGLSSTEYCYITGDHTNAADGDWLMRIMGYHGSTFYGSLDILRHDTDDGEIRFRTRIAGTATDVMTIVDGNVGIGVSNPSDYYSTADDLVVGGSSHHGITIVTGNANTGAIHFADGTSGTAEYAGYIAYQHDGDKLRFGVNASDKLVIQSSGNVGIGTTSPSGKLDVESTSSDVAFFTSTQATTTNVYITNSNATTNNTANLYFAPANNIAGSYIKSTAIEDFSTTANRTSDLRFAVRKDGTFNEAVIIDSSGNVGINDTNPNTANLSIKGQSTGVSANYPMLKLLGQNTSSDGLHITTTGTGNNYYAIKVATGADSSAFNVTNAGNVGIGTASPSEKLEVNGSIKASSSAYVQLEADQTDSAAVRMGVSSASLEGFVMCNNQGDGHISGNTILKMLTYSTGGALIESARFTTNGASIKTTLNAHTLQVGGDIGINTSGNVRFRFYRSGYFKAGIQVPDTAGQMIDSSAVDDLAIRSQNNMLFATGGNIERMRIDSGGQAVFYGDVTLDSDSTKVKLGDNQDLQLYHDGSNSYIETTTGSAGDLYIKAQGTNHDLYLQAADDLVFSTASTERMRISSLGLITLSDIAYAVGSDGTSQPRFVPYGDNTIDLGYSGARWEQLWAATSTINTSDANEKQQIENLDEVELRVAKKLKGLIRKFKWNSAVEKKGEDARINFGIIAQDVKTAFESEGLIAEKYALFCSNTWWEKEVIEINELGNETKKIKILEEYEDGAIEKTRLGIRYSQLLAFIISAL